MDKSRLCHHYGCVVIYVKRILDLMESSIGQSVHRGLERETWEPGRFGCQTSDEVLWKLDALQTFITDLNWPEKVFATHLQHRLKATVKNIRTYYRIFPNE